MQRREIVLFCGGLAEHLRGILRQLPAYAQDDGVLSPRMHQIAGFCEFSGFSIGRVVFSDTAAALEAVEAGRASGIDRAAIVPALSRLLNAVGRHVTGICKPGVAPSLHQLDAARRDLMDKCGLDGRALRRLVNSLEADQHWRASFGASRAAMIPVLNKAIEALKRLDTSFDQGAIEEARRWLVMLEAKNVFPGTNALIQGALVMLDAVDAISDHAPVLHGCRRVLGEFERLLAFNERSRHAHFAFDSSVVTELIDLAGALPGEGARKSGFLQAFSGGPVAENGSVVDQSVSARFSGAMRGVQDAWNLAATTGNFDQVTQILAEFEEKSPLLNIPSFSQLVAALAQAVRDSSGTPTSPTLPVVGAMAILLLGEMASKPDGESGMQGAVESIMYALREREIQSLSAIQTVTPAPFVQRTLAEGLAAVGKHAAKRIAEAKKAIDDVILEKRAVGDGLGDPAALAEIVGGRVSRTVFPLSNAMEALQLSGAAAVCRAAARSAESVATWSNQDAMLPLFNLLVALADFAEHMAAGHAVDLDPPAQETVEKEIPEDNQAEIDTMLIFSAEASELLNELGKIHLALSNADRDASIEEAEVVYRVFHTLKGGARFCGLNRFGTAAEECQLAADRLLAAGGQGTAQLIEGVIGYFSQWVRAFAVAGAEAASIPDVDIQAVCEIARSCATVPLLPAVDLKDFEDLLSPRSAGWGSGRAEIPEVDDPFGILGTTASLPAPAFGMVEPSTAADPDPVAETGAAAVEHEIQLTVPDAVSGGGSEAVVDDSDEMAPDLASLFEDSGFPEMNAAGDADADITPQADLEPENEQEGSSDAVSFTFVPVVAEFSGNAGEEDCEPYAPADEATILALVEQFVRTAHEAHDDVDQGVLPAMADEVTGRLADVMDLLEQCKAGKARREVMEGLKRNIHTLKGCTRTAGLMSAGAICHQVEDHMDAWSHWREGVQFAEAYERAIDQFAEIVDRVREKAMAPCAPIDATSPVATTHVPEKVAEKATGTVRVAVSTLDSLCKSTSEAVILSTRTAEDVSAAWSALRSLDADLDRMRKLMHELEIEAEIRIQAGRALLGASSGKFDPLELDRFTRLQEITRSLSENLSDMTASKVQIQDAVKRLEDVQIRKAAVADTLQHEAGRMMVTPLDTHSGRLMRVVRKACQDAGVQAALSIYGDAEAPAAVIERLLPAIEHILRNAIAHGIEDAPTRRAAGKDEVGRVSISAASLDGEFVLSIQDDGRGIDSAAVLERARALGIAGAGNYSDKEIYQFLFANGFSTADSVTELSGRGVGLDAARNTVKEIGGTVEVSTKEGVGTGFKITVPSDISTMSVVPVGAGDYRCLIPAAVVDRIVSVPAATPPKGTLFVDGMECRYVTLADLVGDVAGWRPQATKGYLQVIVCGMGSGAPMAIQVDSLEAYRRVVVRPLGAFLGGISGLVAGTIAGDGTPLLIVNPLRMTVKELTPGFDKTDSRLPLVMIADDSSTVRVVTSRFLRKHGYDVVEAKDGLDAIDILRNGVVPDMFLLDIEMPRMDGFELIRAVRRIPEHGQTPIVMITSRTAQKHREYALEIGANAYIGKPYEEKELLAVLLRAGTETRSPA